MASDADPTFEIVADLDPSRHRKGCRILAHPEDLTCTCGMPEKEGEV
jgi:hypothetical protein